MEINSCINFILSNAQNAVHNYFKRQLQDYEITPSQYALLHCLYVQDGLTPSQLAQALRLDTSSITGILGRLEKKGLIARESVEHDARCKRIVLTDKADAIVADLKANGDRVERLLVGGFSDGEKAALRDYVARMRANIERAQREFEHQTLPQSPVVMAPDQDGAEVANTKEENE